MRIRLVLALVIAWTALASPGLRADDAAPSGLASESVLSSTTVSQIQIPAGTVLRLAPVTPASVRRLKPGDVVDAKLARAIFLPAIGEVLPEGSRVRLVTASVEKTAPYPNRVRTLFADLVSLYWNQRPAHRQYKATFSSADIVRGDGAEVPIQVSLLRLAERVELPATAAEAQGAQGTSSRRTKKDRSGQLLIVQLDQAAVFSSPTMAGSRTPPDRGPSHPGALSAGAPPLQPGTKAHLLLLNEVTASRTRQGDLLQAQLEEPLRVGDQMTLPPGSLFEGRVSLSVPPRWMNRSAALRLRFQRLILPGGRDLEVSAFLSGAEVEEGASPQLDSEGTLRAPKESKKQVALRLGATYLAGKNADDLGDTIIKLTVGGSNATLTRYIGMGTALVYFIAHRGQNIRLLKYSELEVTFENLPANSTSQANSLGDNIAAGHESGR